jgi:ubiquinone/menaquinone biosynthesis C-methylase UbiE
MTRQLPFPDGNFDAVISNVALHMFPDRVTRTVFAQVARLLRASNLPARELEPDYVIEESGQTMHFFSESYLRDLLAGWRQVHLVQLLLPEHKTSEPSKQVWRGIARR